MHGFVYVYAYIWCIVIVIVEEFVFLFMSPGSCSMTMVLWHEIHHLSRGKNVCCQSVGLPWRLLHTLISLFRLLFVIVCAIDVCIFDICVWLC